MQTDNRFLEDLSRLASGAMGTVSGLRQEIETQVRQRVERLAEEMDLVPRRDFELVRDIAVRARDEQEALSERVALLEAELATLRGQPQQESSGPAGETRSGPGNAREKGDHPSDTS